MLPHFDVFEEGEPGCSKLLDRYGNPIPYESPKQGFMGFVRLR